MKRAARTDVHSRDSYVDVYNCFEAYLRVEFLLKTESGYLRDAEVT